MNRRGITHIYNCLRQHLLGGLGGDRNEILDEIICARKPSAWLSGHRIDRPTNQSNARELLLPRAPPKGSNYCVYGE